MSDHDDPYDIEPGDDSPVDPGRTPWPSHGPRFDRPPAPVYVPPAYSFSEAFSSGFELFKTRYGTALVLVVLYGVVLIAISACANLLDGLVFGWGHPPSGFGRGGYGQGYGSVRVRTQVFQPLANFFLLGPIGVGFFYGGVRLARGEAAGPDDLFRAFGRYGTVLLIGLIAALAVVALIVCIVVPSIIAGAVAGPAGLLIMIPLLVVGFLISVYVGTRFGYAQVLAIDPAAGRLSAVDCLRTSWRVTGPHVFSLIGLNLVLGLITAFTLLMCVLPGVFFGAPLSLCVIGVAYTLIAENARPGPPRRCPRCAYPTRGLAPGTRACPECGIEFE